MNARRILLGFSFVFTFALLVITHYLYGKGGTKMKVLPLLLAFCVFIPTVSAQTGRLTVVYTANSEGKLDDCGCRTDPYGGLGERVTLIRSLRRDSGPFLLLDAGNMISLFGDYELKEATIMTLMNIMGYDAAGVGSYELFFGVSNVRKMSQAGIFPLLSASALAVDGSLALKPWTLCEAGGVKAAVIAVTDSATGYVPAVGREYVYKIIPPEEALKIHLPDMTESADYVIVLSRLPIERNRQLLAEFPAIDLIVQGYGNQKLARPEVTPDGVIVCPGGRGNLVGIVSIGRDANSVKLVSYELLPLLDVPMDPQAERVILEYYNKAGR